MKPNLEKSSEVYDSKLMTHQMRCLGLIENIKVRRAGYPFRMKYSQFMFRYGSGSLWSVVAVLMWSVFTQVQDAGA